MAGTKLGYDFIALPRRRHPKWFGLANGSGQFLFAPLFELNEGRPIPFHGSDWRVWLCRAWCIAGKARSPICKALDEIQQRGLIVVGAGVVSVLFQPSDAHPEEVISHSATTQRTVSDHSAATQQPQLVPNAVSHFDLSIGDNSTLKIQTDREKDRKKERENARAPEILNFRRPLGEPPPGFVDRDESEPTLEDRIIALWRKGVSDKGGGQPADSALARRGAKEVAEWLRSNVRENETPQEAFQVALKLYLAEDKPGLRKNSWPLGWLVERLPGYRIAKQPEKQALASPTHAVWVPRDYESEMRESYDPERIRREREEWFEQYPPAREIWEREQRELEEAPPPRVVVSIAEAKPVKRAEPMTEQQRQERIRFLQAQADQIRAANAAK